MIYIILSIIINALLFIIFKLFKRFNVNTFQAILFNYIFAFILAMSSSKSDYGMAEIPQQNWFFGACILGFLFISIFNVMANTVQKMGLSVTAIAGKMSVVIPIIVGLIVYKESLGAFKLIGILFALVAVFLASIKEDVKLNKEYIYLPVILFLGSGILDALLKYFEKQSVSDNETATYTGTIFFIAFILGIIRVIFQTIKSKFKFQLKNLIAGIVLGVPNYYSIFFLLKALKTNDLESSTVFTINNVGIVLFSTIVGLLLFQEKLSKRNIIGVFFAMCAIVLMTFTIV